MSAVVLTPALLRTPESDRPATGRARVRLQSATAREALAASARRSGATLGALEKDAEDAPLPSNGWHWSLAHDAEWAAGVVHRSPVGIDLERIVERRPELVAPVLSAAERPLLPSPDGPFDWRVFMRLWTAKEAILKCAGVGLGELSLCRLAAPPTADSMVLAYRGESKLVRHAFVGDHVVAVHAPGEDWTVEWPRECLVTA